MNNHIEIKSEETSGIPTMVKLNGEILKHVRLIDYHMEVGLIPRVTIKFLNPTVDIDVIAEDKEKEE